VPIKEIQDFSKKQVKSDKRSKSSSDSSGQERIAVQRNKSQVKEQSKPMAEENLEQKGQDIFCAANQDLNYLATYIDNKIVE
jgi:hypothetical protein